jgi:hypothetical protein
MSGRSGHEFNITAIAIDIAGCIATDEVIFVYDAIEPSITIEYPVNGSTYCEEPTEINGTAEDEETFIDRVYIRIRDNNTTLYWNGSSWIATPTDLECNYVDGFWNYTNVPSWEHNHTYTIYAFAEDAAGNTNDTVSWFTYECVT